LPLSIEESIKKLKAEIIAQDWRLSPKRAAGLEEAFQCLRQRFKNRRATNAMLIMAGSVLDYIKKRGGNPPETIELLKESMAHVVNLYEDLTFDPEKEKLLFAGLFKRFQRLKTKVRGNGSFKPQPGRSVGLPGKGQAVASGQDVKVQNVGGLIDPTKVERLIEDLKNSLDRAGEASIAISKILADTLGPRGLKLAEGEDAETVPAIAPVDFTGQKAPQKVAGQTDIKAGKRQPLNIQVCYPDELRQLTINGVHVAIPAEIVALVRPLKNSKLQKCLQDAQVPLKYFSGFMRRLSHQFNGILATIKDKKLKRIILPIMIPQGFYFVEVPDLQATTMVVISAGNWHGVLACTEVHDETCMMQKFENQKNGDIAGLAHLEDDQQVMLLDSQGILAREGFLLMT